MTVLAAVPIGGAVLAGIHPHDDPVDSDGPNVERLRRWVETSLTPSLSAPPVEYAVAYGLPGVEIGRFAERRETDLVVLGRKPRSLKMRLVVGDTADAVARRSRVPCLFVPAAGGLPRRILAAVDGSDRGMAVLTAAEQFATQVGAELHVTTVDPVGQAVLADAARVVGTRTMRLGARVRAVGGRELEVRWGERVEQILSAADEHGSEVLVIGCHRGGPSGIIDAGSTARRLAHTASCAVLTVPL
jgi:nucleotide-binding universal stress UspA family protein